MKLSIIVLGEKNKHLNNNKDIEIINIKKEINIKDIKKTKGDYITIINDQDIIDNNYTKKILEKINQNPDSIFINYNINYNYKNKIKEMKNENVLNQYIPKLGHYIFAYVFKKTKLIKLLESKNFDEEAKKIFKNRVSIPEITYHHTPKAITYTSNFPLKDTKLTKYYKNIIYIGSGCNGMFNGYITWIDNIGKCFSKDYDITILYDEIYITSLERFKKYFTCVKREDNTNYVCDRLLVTYSTVQYPKNIIYLDKNYLFIHGNMDDYSYTKKIEDDLYTKYIAVSKICAKKAEGYYAGKIDYIYNPFKISSEIMPHLRLTSAQRSSDEKKLDRVEKIASILDEENIPYTWNLFTDKNEGTNKGGLIFRQRTTNPYPYIKDSDYFLLLSDTEACPYVIIEALSLQTKVVVTPLEVHKELGVNENNSITIPFEYFEDKNKEKLRKKVLQMYQEKERTFNYTYKKEMYEKYNTLFKK